MGRIRGKGALGESLGPRLGEGQPRREPGTKASGREDYIEAASIKRGKNHSIQVEIIHYDTNFVKISRGNTHQHGIREKNLLL